MPEIPRNQGAYSDVTEEWERTDQKITSTHPASGSMYVNHPLLVNGMEHNFNYELDVSGSSQIKRMEKEITELKKEIEKLKQLVEKQSGKPKKKENTLDNIL